MKKEVKVITTKIKYPVGSKFEKDLKVEVEVIKFQPYEFTEDFQYWCKVRAGSWGDMTWYTEEELDELNPIPPFSFPFSTSTWYTEEELDELNQLEELPGALELDQVDESLLPQLGEIWKCECYFYNGHLNRDFREFPFIKTKKGWRDSETVWEADMTGCPIPICKLEELEDLEDLSERVSDISDISENVIEPQVGEMWDCEVYNNLAAPNFSSHRVRTVLLKTKKGWRSKLSFCLDDDLDAPLPIRKLLEEEISDVAVFERSFQFGELWSCDVGDENYYGHAQTVILTRRENGWNSIDKIWKDDDEDCPIPVYKLAGNGVTIEDISTIPQMCDFWECKVSSFGGTLEAPLVEKNLILYRLYNGWRSKDRIWLDEDTLCPIPVKKVTEEDRMDINPNDYRFQAEEVWKCRYLNPDGSWKGAILPFTRRQNSWMDSEKMWSDSAIDCPIPIFKLVEGE